MLEAFRRLGHEAEGFYWRSYFDGEGPVGRFSGRAQNKLLAGPRLRRLARDLVARAERFKPDLTFVYRGTHLGPGAIDAVKAASPAGEVFGYMNDDPFSAASPRYLWRHFLGAVPRYDAVLAYRHHNIAEFRALGARRVELLRSWFVPWLNKPATWPVEGRSGFDCDVVFVGHYERDGRIPTLEAVARRGWRLRLYGPGYDWDPAIRGSRELADQAPVRLVWNEEYNRALCGAKIALCFLSKLNRDTYTRRCFEIPATGTLLLSEHSDDLAGLYREGVEADFFRSPEEMLGKLELYLGDDERRRRVAAAGQAVVLRDGHDVLSRMRQVVRWTRHGGALTA